MTLGMTLCMIILSFATALCLSLFFNNSVIYCHSWTFAELPAIRKCPYRAHCRFEKVLSPSSWVEIYSLLPPEIREVSPLIASRGPSVSYYHRKNPQQKHRTELQCLES